MNDLLSKDGHLKVRKDQKTQFLKELEELLEKLSIQLRYEKGNFQGGLCTYDNKSCLILNKNHTVDQRLNILRNEMQLLNLDEFFIRPALREFLGI